ncbi:MAG: M55 family metallopeptidase [Anaerolineae bacterium]
MKILIATDMEGISGVVHWDHVDPKHADYPRFRKLMTGDVNAAIRGAFDGGAIAVIVSDGHGDGRNLLLEDLDPRAELNAGSPSPLSMVQGADSGLSAAFLVGYHARAGSQNAILDHTWSGRVANLWLNGRIVGEIGLNAALCGHFGLPILLVSGDQTACAEAVDLLGPVETAVVKRASGRMAAQCLPPSAAQQVIYEASLRAVRRLAAGEAPPPFRLESPITLCLELIQSDMADRSASLPGARRLDGRRIEVTEPDAPAAFRSFRALVALARE